jgi:hypothetical protein
MSLDKKNQRFKKFLGSFIILGMFIFVFVSATFMVSMSIAEKHSSVHFVEDHMAVLNNLVDRSEKLAIINVAN